MLKEEEEEVFKMEKIKVEDNLNLVKKVIHEKFGGDNNPNFTFDEMFSFGVEGLIKAVKAFDYEKGYKFSTVAYPIIQKTIITEMNRDRWVYKKWHSQDYAPIDYLETPLAKTEKSSPNSEIDNTLMGILRNEKDFATEIAEKDFHRNLHECIYALERYEQEIIVAYFYENFTMKEVAEIYGCTQANIMRHINRITKKMHRVMKLVV